MSVTPDRRLTVLLFFAAVALLAATIVYLVIALGPQFHDFPDRTIGVSLLSDVDPRYRTYLFLLLSALGIALCWGLFTLTRWAPGIDWHPAMEPLTGLLAAGAAMNLLAALVHPDRGLFLAGAALGLLLLGLWALHQRLEKASTADETGFVLEVGLAWQALTMAYWLAGLQVDYLFLAVIVLVYPFGWYLRRWPGIGGRLATLWILLAPLLLIIAIEGAYFIFQGENSAGKTLALFALMSVTVVALALPWKKLTPSLPHVAALCVLVSTTVLNEYTGEIVYRGYDVFHLAERLLPLQQYADFGLYPILDFQPAHGLFDVLPQALYQWLHGGDPLESMIWGNGYFHGWLMRAVYIAIFYLCLARLLGLSTAFFLLWLLPHFHLLEPYNTLLLLPVINIGWIATTQRLKTAWALQWVLVLLLSLWRPDFGMVVAAGNLVLLVVLAWYHRDGRQVGAALVTLLAVALPAAALSVAMAGTEKLLELHAVMRPYMGIQILAASYDHFYRQWDYLATAQYLILPGLGVLAGGYSLARLYLRQDRRQFALHLLIVFLTAIGFALAIRLFHRHTIAEGFSKPYFFILATLLAMATLRMHGRLLAPVLAIAVMAGFLAVPKMRNHPEDSLWGPQRSYPLGTRNLNLPQIVQTGPRLVDEVDRFDVFQAFSRNYLQRGETIYDFSNAPLLYALAGVRVPLYVNEAVYHTSETMQSIVLADLGRLHGQKRLPLVVFRQNNPWDALDGVDNALRSYRVVEFIYANYRPCIQVGKLELWLDKGRNCEADIARKVPAEVLREEKIRFLPRNYLQQFIDFGHIPYIWANFDEIDETVETPVTLAINQVGPTEQLLESGRLQDCTRAACYLDLTVNSQLQQHISLRFAKQRQLSFTVRPGEHRYRIRISALWRWYRGGSFDRLRLSAGDAFSVRSASLYRVAG